ncbi:GPN-loop GTPase [Candidatus Norongarragalina meridionalis]|nr:GPN-loop GTPase [Candidatus Norongarragalina meridionalis]
MLRIALIGGGGVGKSTLAYAFSSYCRKQGVSVAIANLDPGCKHIKYTPAFDVRKYYSLDKIMRSAELGPNGALKRIHNSLLSNKKAMKELGAVESDFVFIDTAGSLELFLTEGGADFLEQSADLVLFVCDNEAAQSEDDMVLLKAINAIQRLKYCLPTLTVINKGDLLTRRKQKNGQTVLGGMAAVNAHLRALLSEVGKRERLLVVSAVERRGFGELFDAINESKCECGDLE